MLLRDWRAGVRILALALVVAVASVTSVGFFADRVRQSLTREAHQLLGADLAMIADHPWPQTVRNEIARRGLRLAEAPALSAWRARAIRPNCRSQGGVWRLSVARQVARCGGLNRPDAETDAVPRQGSTWVDGRLALALALTVGDTLELGAIKLRVGAILTLEPDRGVSFFNIAPRLMMNLADIPATGLVQAGSRVWYQLLAAGPRASVEAFELWVTPRLGRGESLQSLANARPEIRVTLERAQKFVGLTSLLAVVLAAVAISLGTRRYTERHLDGCAVMRCAGASQRQLLGLFAGEFAALGVVAGAAGCIAGYLAQLLIAWLVADLVPMPLPQPTLLPALQGFLIGIALLLGFALPPLLQLQHVPALRVIRRDLGLPRERALAAYGAGLAVIAVLLVWQAGEARLGLIVLGGFAAAFVAFGGIAFGALHVLGGEIGRAHV